MWNPNQADTFYKADPEPGTEIVFLFLKTSIRWTPDWIDNVVYGITSLK